MATAACIVFALLLAVKPCYSSMTVAINGPILNTTFEFSSVFSTPFVNLPFNGITGATYHFPNVSSCGPFPPPTYELQATNLSFILAENYSECILEKVNFAKLAGYEALLTYVEDDTNSTITSALVATGFPVVILPQEIAAAVIENGTVRSEYDTTLVTLEPNIILGIAIVVLSFFLFWCLCCMGLVWALLCCRARNEAHMRQHVQRREEERNDPGRRELIESILRHLAELEDSMGLQVPLGKIQATSLPTRLFRKGKERDETCSVCVDDFEDGVPVKVLPCHHIFHPACIDQWLSEYSSVCPMCKADVRRPAGTHGNRNIGSDEDVCSTDPNQAFVGLGGPSRPYGSVSV